MSDWMRSTSAPAFTSGAAGSGGAGGAAPWPRPLPYGGDANIAGPSCDAAYEAALDNQRRLNHPADPSPFGTYSPPPLWRDVALFVGTALAVGGLVFEGLRRLVKR